MGYLLPERMSAGFGKLAMIYWDSIEWLACLKYILVFCVLTRDEIFDLFPAFAQLFCLIEVVILRFFHSQLRLSLHFPFLNSFSYIVLNFLRFS